MNERIKELAEQAGINMDAFQFSGTPIKHIVDEPSLEKFAELIIQDCIDCVDGYTKPRTFSTHYDAVEQIKHLFGIK